MGERVSHTEPSECIYAGVTLSDNGRCFVHRPFKDIEGRDYPKRGLHASPKWVERHAQKVGLIINNIMSINEPNIEVRDFQSGDWYWIHKSVIRDYAKKVGALGIAVYNVLASLADSNQRCFPSQKYIADRLGYSRGAVNKAIKTLTGCKLVGIVKRGGGSCEYLLLKIGSCKAEETKLSPAGSWRCESSEH